MSKKIVLVEDEDPLRDNIKEILELNDYEVFRFINGLDALEFLNHNQVDLIISDLMMPIINGHELLNKLKSNPITAKFPFILLSAKIESSDKERSLELGADLYLTKPIRTLDLIKSIHLLLK